MKAANAPRRQGTQICEVLLRHLLPCAAQRWNGRIDLSEVRKKADRENLKISPFEKAPKGAFFVHFDDPFCSKPPMSTRCLPAETPGAQGLAGFPRGSPSTLPSTHFFAPILETPEIAAKIFEISENIWGYDIDTLSARKKLR